MRSEDVGIDSGIGSDIFTMWFAHMSCTSVGFEEGVLLGKVEMSMSQPMSMDLFAEATSDTAFISPVCLLLHLNFHDL